jgi:hypothetical protein
MQLFTKDGGRFSKRKFYEIQIFFQKNLYLIKFAFTKPLHGSKKPDFAKCLKTLYQPFLDSTTE